MKEEPSECALPEAISSLQKSQILDIVPRPHARVAQLVEHTSDTGRVLGSIPSTRTVMFFGPKASREYHVYP